MVLLALCAIAWSCWNKHCPRGKFRLRKGSSTGRRTSFGSWNEKFKKKLGQNKSDILTNVTVTSK